jgi:dTDP-4-dehydrorhamnose 3,5-epimerase
MEVEPTALPGVFLLRPRRFPDARGYFVETYNQHAFKEAGIDVEFVQDNLSFSFRRGTIRGLHFQLPPETQAKLVRVLHGAIFDVAVDLRTNSPTFGKWLSSNLSAEGGEQLFIPRGFGHGFCTLESDTQVAYKVDAYYASGCDSGIVWNDPTLDINWPAAPSEAILSEKDLRLGRFDQFASPFLM